jgi:hypothetical protein
VAPPQNWLTERTIGLEKAREPGDSSGDRLREGPQKCHMAEIFLTTYLFLHQQLVNSAWCRWWQNKWAEIVSSRL